MPDFSIGVDLGGTNLRIAAVSSEGQLLEKVTLGTKVALGRDHVITEMCDAIQRLSGKYKAGKVSWRRHRRSRHHRHANRNAAEVGQPSRL
jgi:predicted NBD/HSP70 family sugar kinase